MAALSMKTTLRTSLNQSAADGWWWQSRFCTGRCHLMNRDKTRLAAPAPTNKRIYASLFRSNEHRARALSKPRSRTLFIISRCVLYSFCWKKWDNPFAYSLNIIRRYTYFLIELDLFGNDLLFV
jgi:hypothetical protein